MDLWLVFPLLNSLTSQFCYCQAVAKYDVGELDKGNAKQYKIVMLASWVKETLTIDPCMQFELYSMKSLAVAKL